MFNADPNGSWDAGASSTQTITGDRAVSFRFRTTNGPRAMVGLNGTDSSTTPSDLDYAIELYGSNAVRLYEDGVRVDPPSGSVWFTRTDDTDVCTIERVGNTVSYLRTGQIFYQSSKPASGTYRADTSFVWPDRAVGDVVPANSETDSPVVSCSTPAPESSNSGREFGRCRSARSGRRHHADWRSGRVDAAVDHQ